MSQTPRPFPLGTRLSHGDLAAIGDHVAGVIEAKVPLAVRGELVRAGLSVADDDGLLEVQRDHAFLRAARRRVEDDKRAIRDNLIRWLVPLLCTSLVGAVALVARHFNL